MVAVAEFAGLDAHLAGSSSMSVKIVGVVAGVGGYVNRGGSEKMVRRSI